MILFHMILASSFISPEPKEANTHFVKCFSNEGVATYQGRVEKLKQYSLDNETNINFYQVKDADTKKRLHNFWTLFENAHR